MRDIIAMAGVALGSASKAVRCLHSAGVVSCGFYWQLTQPPVLPARLISLEIALALPRHRVPWFVDGVFGHVHLPPCSQFDVWSSVPFVLTLTVHNCTFTDGDQS